MSDNPIRIRKKLRRSRRGATAVEFAMIAPVFFLILFASVELGRAFMVVHALDSASSEAVRVAVVHGASNEEVQDIVKQILNTAGIKSYDVEIIPDDLDVVQEFDPVTVRIFTAYENVSWLPMPAFFANIELSGNCTQPREASAISD